ncbi:MAG: hypothetical protein JWM50_2392 [Microbacteriaceae bacterium]|jgi:hypothetical protein|nr:hypothetical protein [Microbacteriaceae bacterium]
MSLSRTAAFVAAAALSVALAAPSIASAQPASPAAVGRTGSSVTTGAPAGASAAPAPSDDDVIELDDASLAARPAVELSGEVLVVVSEPALDAPSASDHADDLLSYRVITGAGESVAITGDIPTGVESGDTFDGVVAVPSDVVTALPVSSAADVRSSTSADPVTEQSAAAADVLLASEAAVVALPVASATVTSAAVASASVASEHQLQIVVVNPVGVAATTSTDAALLSLSAQATGFWSSLSRGLIPSFADAGPVVRIASATACNADPHRRWNEAAAALGYSTGAAYVSAAPVGVERHLLVVLPSGCLAASGPGVATVGSSLHAGGLAQVVVGAGVDRQVMTHELGHNLSLGHSNLDFCAADAATSGCSTYEYSDVYDVMGVSIVGLDAGVATLNGRDQVALQFQGVAAANQYVLGGSGSRTITATIGTLDAGVAPTIITVVDPLTSETYFVEYRGGEYGRASYSTPRNQGVAEGKSLRVAPGVRLLRSTAQNGSSVLTQSDASYGTGFSRAFAAVGKPVQNPTGSVRLSVSSASEAGGAAVSITLTGATATTVGAAAPASQPVYRFWSPLYNGHFFTISAAERDSIIATYPASTWSYEGPAFEAFTTQVAGTVPLYRFWSPRMNGHFYTTSAAEKEHILQVYDRDTWTYESVAYFVYPVDTAVANTATVARFWSPTYQHHFYTASGAERDSVMTRYSADIWTYEGDNFRVPLN